MKTMPAYRIPGWQQPPQLTEVEQPDPGPGQVVVRVAGCGLCHSDLAMHQLPAEMGEQLGWQPSFTLGHETAGWVEKVGAHVGGVRAGDAVALASPTSCGRCRRCRRGQENACPHGTVGRGYGRDGGLAQFVLVEDPRALLPLGDLDPSVAGPLTDAGATSFHAVRRILPHVQDDSSVVVVGVGGLGSFVVQALRATTTARIIAVDPDPARRDLARGWGAHDVLDGIDGSSAALLAGLLGAGGADAVIDLVGSDATISGGLGALGPGGALALVGAAQGTLRRPWYPSLPRDGEVFTFQGSDLADARAVIDLAATGAIEVPTRSYALDDVAEAYAALAAGTLTGRAVIHP